MEDKEKRIMQNKYLIAKAKEHFNYGISHDIFKEPVTSYASQAIEALSLMEDIISKDSVVLTREEYEKIIHERDEYLNDRFAVCYAFRQARKETAREIITIIKDFYGDISVIAEIAKQYDVED